MIFQSASFCAQDFQVRTYIGVLLAAGGQQHHDRGKGKPAVHRIGLCEQRPVPLGGDVPLLGRQGVQEVPGHARDDDPTQFADEPQTDVFMAVADTLGYEVKNNVEDYSKGLPNDLALITGAYVRGE